MDNQALHVAVAAVCPIDGVAIVDPADKATWRIDFQPQATGPQRAAAQVALLTFVDPSPPTASDRAARDASDNDAIRALVRVFAEYTQNPQSRTAAQIIARMRALA